MKKRLFTPGPTTVPESVLLKMAEPIIHHRSAEYGELFAQINKGLKYLFQTENDVLTFTSSGTGAMEAAVVNLLSPGDRALVVRGGKFGERWAEICLAYGVQVEPLDVEWGYAVEPQQIAAKLQSIPEIKAVFTTHSETSTGVINDIETIGQIVKQHPALLVVDVITSIGTHRFLPDQWHIDVAVAGSQKGLMLPPGLAFASVSQKAWEAAESSKLPKYYWSFSAAKKSLAKNQNPYTPAVSLLVGLKKSLEIIQEEGLEKVWARHQRHARATRAAVRAMGLELFAKNPSNILTIVKIPEGIDGKLLLKTIGTKYGVTMAGGQAALAGKVVRISHMGYTDDFDILTAVAALERGLKDLGWHFELGSGVAAAQRVLTEENGREL
ncbi:MAG: aminotransferase [Candidatus Latescibacterota bacterium]|nr:MAG: aminotransferase [Candidatus Latescibacterota bacterium]